MERIGEEFPNAEVEIPGIYPNGRLLDVLGAEPMTDFVGTFHEEMEQDPRTFRMALSELADVMVAFEQDSGKQDGRWGLWETQRNTGWSERGKIYAEMSEAEQKHYDNVFGGIVGYYYWTTEQDWFEQLPYRDFLPFPYLKRLRLDLPSLEH